MKYLNKNSKIIFSVLISQMLGVFFQPPPLLTPTAQKTEVWLSSTKIFIFSLQLKANFHEYVA